MEAQKRYQSALIVVQMRPDSLWDQASGGAAIVVVETAEHGDGDDLARLRRLHLWRHGDALGDNPSTTLKAGLVRSRKGLSSSLKWQSNHLTIVD